MLLPILIIGAGAPSIFNLLSYTPAAVQATLSMWYRLPNEALDLLPSALLTVFGLGLALHVLGPVGPTGLRNLYPRRLYNRIQQSAIMEAFQSWSPQITTVVVFSVHALLPSFSAYSAVKMAMPVGSSNVRIPHGWGLLHWLSFTLLGTYNLAAVVLSHIQNEHPPQNRFMQGMMHILENFQTISKACCVFAAWVYTSIALDLTATWIWYGAFHCDGSTAGTAQKTTLLGVVGVVAFILGAPGDVNPLASERTIIFVLSALSVASQQRLLDLLRRREVLLRLIGAERVMASTLCLLLKGVAALVNGRAIAEFLMRVAPPAPVCVLIVVARKHAVGFGISLAVLPLLGDWGWLASLVVGLVTGAWITAVILHEWYTNAPDLQSEATRLIFLVPGNVSFRAKGLLKDLLDNARKRAVQFVAVGLLDRAVRWAWTRVGRRAALPP